MWRRHTCHVRCAHGMWSARDLIKAHIEGLQMRDAYETYTEGLHRGTLIRHT